MKTGNKILIILIGTIAFVMLAGAIDLRFFQHKSPFNKTTAQHKNSIAGISDFKYIKIRKIPSVDLIMSDSSIIKVVYKGKGFMPVVSYSFSGDTLVLDSVSNKKNLVRIEILYRKNLSGVDAFHSKIRMSLKLQEYLRMILDSSRISDLTFGFEEMKIRNLNVALVNHSSLCFDNIFVDNMDLQSNGSMIEIMSRIKKLTGNIHGNSKLNFMQVEEIYLKKEKGSTMQFND